MAKLPSEQNDSDTEQDVLAAFDIEPHEVHAFFEHGQWWVQCNCGAQWSVVDVERRGGESDFDFEQVSEGDEDYHQDDEDYRDNSKKRRRKRFLDSGDKVVPVKGFPYEGEVFRDGKPYGWIQLGPGQEPRSHLPMRLRGDHTAKGMRPNTMRIGSRWQIGDTGAVYEFRVKLSMRVRGVNITDGQLEQETRLAVDVFADQLRSDYPWVGDVYLTGRSGGWLAVKDKLGQATEDELSDINDGVDQARKDFESAIIESFGYTENGANAKGIDPKLRKAYDFFRAHAGGIVGESAKGALSLARAEKKAEELGWYVDWEEDPEEYQMGDAETERPFEVLTATLKDEGGEWLGALGGIGFTGETRRDRDYGRLIEAELALEALSRKGLL